MSQEKDQDQTFKVSDTVEWHGPGAIRGTVVKKLTKPMEIEDHHVAASEDDPQYLVRSDKTGKEAAHHPSALRKVK
jgi:hypothetical protein